MEKRILTVVVVVVVNKQNQRNVKQREERESCTSVCFAPPWKREAVGTGWQEGRR